MKTHCMPDTVLSRLYILSLFLQESYEAGIIIYIVREGNQDLRGTGKCPSFQLALEPRWPSNSPELLLLHRYHLPKLSSRRITWKHWMRPTKLSCHKSSRLLSPERIWSDLGWQINSSYSDFQERQPSLFRVLKHLWFSLSFSHVVQT